MPNSLVDEVLMWNQLSAAHFLQVVILQQRQSMGGGLQEALLQQNNSFEQH